MGILLVFTLIIFYIIYINSNYDNQKYIIPITENYTLSNLYNAPFEPDGYTGLGVYSYNNLIPKARRDVNLDYLNFYNNEPAVFP
jgi:hypothetical protein